MRLLERGAVPLADGSTRFSVWAPAASLVEVALTRDGKSELHPLVRGSDGVHGATVRRVPAGSDYSYRLDGGPDRPDPVSRWRPQGVHGPTRVVDPAAFQWTDAGWRGFETADLAIYELHVGTCTPSGTFDGVIERLPVLRELGITAIEIMPVAEFPGGRNWGYDGVSPYAVQSTYGGPNGLKRLVDAAHRAGLAVLLDVVYNHLGPEGNYLGEFGPYFSDRHRTAWGQGFNLDGPDSDEVRSFFVDNATRWLRDFHVDGLRLDAVHAAIDTSPVHLLETLRWAADEVGRQAGRPKVLIAEFEGNDPRVVRPIAAGGYGLDAHWNDDVHHALHTALTGERTSYYEDYDGFGDLVACLQGGYAYAGRYSVHRRRTVGRTPEGIDGSALVACLQNHDQIGNRARGDRFAAAASPARQKIGAALLLTSPFVPLLFMGEEWAASSPFPYFADHEGDLAEAVRRGRLAEFAAFGWDPADVTDPEDDATFAAATLRWDERESDGHGEMLDWYRSLLRLRADHAALRDPTFARVAAVWDAERGVVVVRRTALTVLACVAADGADVTVRPGEALELLLASDGGVKADGDTVHLLPDSVAVVRAAAGA
jgi:maltooligosyltrehalose trehalohydrolase